MAESPHGRFVWYEMLTVDKRPTIDFYKEVVGWDTQEWESGEQPYTMFTIGEAPVGGIMDLPAEAKAGGAPPHWLAYVSIPDTDATVEQAQGLGAKVLVEPMSIPEVGRMAVLSDPQGAVFAVFTPASESPGGDGPPQVGEFSWHELATSDYQAGFEFYSALFGWEKTNDMDMGEGMGVYQMYGTGERELGGMYNLSPAIPAPPHWLLYVTVPDVDAAVETVKSLGGQVLNGPMDVPGGDRVAQCLDRQGAAFALHSTKGAEA
jgi:predicted enzyme related to lactoylglutathione lyase